MEKRKEEIDLEVNRRVEAAKKQMEREMMQELEKRREQIREEEQKREVGSEIIGYASPVSTSCLHPIQFHTQTTTSPHSNINETSKITNWSRDIFSPTLFIYIFCISSLK